MTNLSLLSNDYELSERISSAETTRSFILSILKEDQREEIVKEYRTKLDAINKEIDELTKDL